MKVLVACEHSGVVRDAFAKKGHLAYSCDFLGSETPGNHFKGNVRKIIDKGWDLLIAHPPCTYLSVSGLHWNNRTEGRSDLTDYALAFFRFLLEADIPKICIENPVGVASTRIRKPDQSIQPYEFGHDASKKTCLWLKNLPLLIPTNYIAPQLIDGKPRWANQTVNGQSREGPSEDRWKIRSKTYSGIAQAMANQWG